MLTSDKDLLKWAKQILAAKDPVASTQRTSPQADYDRIAKGDQNNVIDRIKKEGLIL